MIITTSSATNWTHNIEGGAAGTGGAASAAGASAGGVGEAGIDGRNYLVQV